MLPSGGRVLVALSGGPDSVTLLHVLQTLERRGHLVVAGAAHFNHQLRGAEADADELFCRELAASLNLPIVVGRGDVRGMAGESGRSIEDAARTARYGFLNDAAASFDAGAIAVGHSLEDQAETFLLRLIRGAGPAGLAGVRPRAGIVIRPLLEIPRAELRAYAGEHGLRFREDSSNADVGIPRNRVRLELLPHLEQFSPAIAAILAREAALARADDEFLEAAAIEWAAFDRLTGRQRRRARRRGAGGPSPRSGLPCGADSFAGSCARPLHRFSACRRFAGPHPTRGRVGGRIAGTGGEAKGTPDRARRRLGGALCELFQRSVVYSR